MSECKICDEPTETVFNINFKAVHICDSCSLTITQQEVAAWSTYFRPLTRLERAAHKVLRAKGGSKADRVARGLSLTQRSKV